MATPTIKTKGFRALVKRLRGLPAKLQVKINEEVAKSTVRVQRDARRSVAVDTGRLRSSIRFDISGDGQIGEIFTEVEYAAFIEFGTVNTDARPYLFPAWNQERPKFIKKISDIVGRSL